MRATKGFILFLLIIAFMSTGEKAFSQKSNNQNQISFLDVFIGHAVGNAGGFSLGLGINYQVNRSFFTARALGTIKLGAANPDPLYHASFFASKNGMGELALLYGLRTIERGHAYSFSLGASYNQYFDQTTDYKYFGVPFEANIKWFKREKKRHRILLGLVPIGEPTGFGDSFGFKLFGNISKQSYAGLGLSFGLGYHKVYD